MMTPAAGIVCTAEPLRCTECRVDLTNVTRYPGPVQFRCLNRACGLCSLAPAQPVRIPAGVAIGAWS